MRLPALVPFAALFPALSLHALQFDELVAGNISATNVTVSFRTLDDAKAEVPTTAVLRWGTTPDLGSETREQHAGGAKPDQPVGGFRILYADGLKPATLYHWQVIATAADGTTAEKSGTCTTLPVDASRKRGPDGTHVPPHTPAYATPATHVAATWGDINALLKTCRGGEVIEIAQETADEKSVSLTGGSEAWETNVLIRPPLGRRAANRAGVIEINSPHITVAGVHLSSGFMYPTHGNHHGNADKVGAKRAFFWMCTVAHHGTLLANGCPDSGWYEVVAPARGVGGDRAQIKTYGKIAPSNFTIAGCWLEGKDRTNFKDHSDTLQTLGFGQPIAGLRLIDTVFFRSANCSGQMTDLADVLIQNCWFGPLAPRSKVCGSFYATLGTHQGWTIRDSDWNGKFRQTAAPREIVNSRIPGIVQGKAEDADQEGQEEPATSGLYPQPPLPDLSAIWPK